MGANSDLVAAKKNKNDEFYTQLTDIEKEMKNYKQHFKGKVVYCNCDDPRISNFFHYFAYNFKKLELKKLLASCYRSKNICSFSQHNCDQAVYLEYDGSQNDTSVPDLDDIAVQKLRDDGDFRNAESIEILKSADVVVTNPPFSLFRDYVAQLIEYKKKFIILGNLNALTTKEIFSLLAANKIWLGQSIHSGDREFQVPDHYPLNAASHRIDENGNRFIRVKGVRWFTNLDYSQRHEDLILYKEYSPEEYPTFDNYDAINVKKVADIPRNYDGAMGVPITFFDKYNPDQFEILSANDFRFNDTTPFKQHGLIKDKDGTINGKATYVRVVIRNKQL